MRKLGISIAVEEEACEVLGCAEFGWRSTGIKRWTSADGRMQLALSGVGKVFASWAASMLSLECDTVCTMGTSGGLSDEKIGALYLCTEFVEHDMGGKAFGVGDGITPLSEMKSFVISNCTRETELAVREACARSKLELNSARAMSGDIFLTDAESAAHKRDDFGVSLVDMESAAAAKVCAFRSSRDFFALRWVSDNANHASRGTWEENVRRSSKDFRDILIELRKDFS